MLNSPLNADDRVYAAIDLETTGLHADRHRIIEVGAVKFRGSEVLDEFKTYVNPYTPIPQFVRRLTGIRQADVDGAPPFASVSVHLEEFLGDVPVIGHNVAFDVGFLKQNGLPMANVAYDTWDMASVLLPEASEYSLSLLAKSLGIDHDAPHRALDDARVTRLVFLALLERAKELDPVVAERIRIIARRSGWSFGDLVGSEALFHAPGFDGPVDSNKLAQRLTRPESLPRPEEEQTLDVKRVEAMASAEGLLSKFFPGFEYRPEQKQMISAVTRTFGEGGHLMVEGGTGVGKSVAYLLPAILFAVANGQRVVVSTNTINLQEQLLQKDIPALTAALEKAGEIPEGGLRAVSLKGRANYFCIRRWTNLSRSDSLSTDDARLLSKCLVWLQNTPTGDRGEMNLAGRDWQSWIRVSASDKGFCPGLRQGLCFLRAARERAETAHVIVVNHALLLSDLARGGGLIPEYNHLVVDEAHHLEEEATRQFGFSVSQDWLEEHLDAIARYVEQAQIILRTQRLPAQQALRFQELTTAVQESVSSLRDKWENMWNLAEEFVMNHRNEYDSRVQLRISRSARTQPGWSDVEIGWENCDGAIQQFRGRVEELARYLVSLSVDGSDPWDTLLSDLDGWLEDLAEIREQLHTVASADFQDERIDWLSQERDSSMVFNSAPLDVGPTLRSGLFDQKECVVLSSATLTAQGTFDFIRHRLGLEGAEELRVGSPFDYKKSTLLAVPDDIPPPNARGYRDALERCIGQIVRNAGGHTMALFTSHAALRAARQTLIRTVEDSGITVLAQGVDGPPHRLMRRFAENPRSVLLGTSSFWEGVDLPSGVMKALILARLPFNVPTEPVFAARGEQYDDPFREFAVPQAVLRFRQGFGRLIRNAQDRGAVVVLDRRVLNGYYGRHFIDALPECTMNIGPMASIVESVNRW